jgi:hypothetical protein
VETRQNPSQQRQRRGGNQLPPEHGADRLAQDAAAGVHVSRILQGAEIILASRTMGQRVAAQNSGFPGQRSFFSN